MNIDVSVVPDSAGTLRSFPSLRPVEQFWKHFFCFVLDSEDVVWVWGVHAARLSPFPLSG